MKPGKTKFKGTASIVAHQIAGPGFPPGVILAALFDKSSEKHWLLKCDSKSAVVNLSTTNCEYILGPQSRTRIYNSRLTAEFSTIQLLRSDADRLDFALIAASIGEEVP